MGMRQQEREHALTRVQRRYTTRDGGRPRAVRRRRKRGENGGACGGAGEREAMRRRVGRDYYDSMRCEPARGNCRSETVYDQCGRARLTLSGVRSCAHLFGQELCAGGHGESRVNQAVAGVSRTGWACQPERETEMRRLQQPWLLQPH